LKEKIRILLIDDQPTDLVQALKNEGWTVEYAEDLESFRDPHLIDAHIVCVDILGVGRKLKCDGEGQGLVKAIKGMYPTKKILMYSSQTSHNIFSDSVDMVDKRVFKDGQIYPFQKAIHDLALSVFDWDTVTAELYRKYFSAQMTEEQFKEKLKRALTHGKAVDVQSIAKIAGTTLGVAAQIAAIVQVFK
jgi:hypothetical protein